MITCDSPAFATLAWFARGAVQWTGKPVSFRSSPIAVRTHCGAYGTPLYLAYDARDDVALTVGTFDTLEAVHPTHHTAPRAGSPGARRQVKDELARRSALSRARQQNKI